jgi:hypothetical protein
MDISSGLLPFGILLAIWYVLWSFWYIIPVLVCCTNKNLATLMGISEPADCDRKYLYNHRIIVAAVVVGAQVPTYGSVYAVSKCVHFFQFFKKICGQ